MARIYARDNARTPTSDTMLDRARPAIMRGSVRDDRESEIERVDLHPEFDANKWANPTNLDAPAPRPGFSQRWIADGISPTTGLPSKEWARKMREGYAPRDAATLSARDRQIYPSAKTQSGNDVIRMAGLVLCEIPRALAEQRRLAVKDILSRQRESVPEAINELRKKQEAVRGVLGEAQLTDEERSFTGRRAATMI